MACVQAMLKDVRPSIHMHSIETSKETCLPFGALIFRVWATDPDVKGGFQNPRTRAPSTLI